MAAFQVSKTANKILKNFAGISNSVLLVEGQLQRTMAASKSVLALAKFPEAWPKQTGIYDLTTFLGTLAMFDKPAIQFEDEAFNISENKMTVKYRYSDPSTIQTPPNKTLPSNNPDVEFVLSADVLTRINKASALLGLPTVTLDASGENVKVRVSDEKNPTSHGVTIDVEGTPGSKDAILPVAQEHLAMLLDGDYTVSLSTAWKYGFFRHNTEPVSYFIVGQI